MTDYTLTGVMLLVADDGVAVRSTARRYDLERDRATVLLHQLLQLLRSQHFLSVDLLDNVTDV